MASQRMYGLKVSLPSELRERTLRAVLDYEATVRGLTLGQVAEELVMEAIDLDSYPPEVRSRLDEIAVRTRARAEEKSLRAAGLSVA